jgi:transposase
VLVLNPRQTSSWATSLGLRAKTDGVDAQTLARGLLAGYARASTVPDETVQALRALTRTRRDLVQRRTAAVQRLHDELVLLFPELVRHLATWPGTPQIASPAVLQLLSTDNSAAVVRGAPEDLTHLLEEVSGGRWGAAQATALQDLAQHSIASTRAVAARALVVRTLALHLLDLQTRLAELETAIAELLRTDAPGQHLQQQVPGVGPKIAATVRAELGEVTRFSRVDQVIAYAGLEPRTRQSGAYVGQTHLSKHGPGALRHAPSRAVLSAIRARPAWRARYERLVDRGRAKKEALAILSRALLKIIYYILRTGATYDPACVKPGLPAGRA